MTTGIKTHKDMDTALGGVDRNCSPDNVILPPRPGEMAHIPPNRGGVWPI
jgi:hypothetical protein